MAAEIEVSELDTLDLSGYRCVYISFGSKEHPDPKKPRFYQDFPYFLEEINKFPLLCISIDKYDTFEKEERVVPINPFDITPRNTYTRVTIPTRTMDETIRITQQLVELVSKNNPEQVFFVNFIKYRNKNAHDAGPETAAMEILSHLRQYKDCYYDWYGFGLFHDFIIKNTPFSDRVKMILYSKDNPQKEGFLDILKNDNSLIDLFPTIHTMLRRSLIDITPTITPEQIALLEPELPKFTAGKRTRKRRRRRRTRR